MDVTNVAKELDCFIKNNDYNIFIEVEACPSSLEKFFNKYKTMTGCQIDQNTDGVIALDESADKWGLELRLYLHQRPDCISSTKNTVYRSEYSYRVNNVKIIQQLFSLGYRIGLNY